MSENTEVEVSYGEDQSKTAQNLLAAAERLGHPANVVRTTSEGHFLVPEDVAKDADAYSAKSGDEGENKAPAKKAAAKKATAKKSTSRKPAKKAAAKKAPAKKAASSPEPTPTPDAPKSEGTNTETQE